MVVMVVAGLDGGPIVPVPVDLTNATSRWLNHTDKLRFTVSDWIYQVDASNAD
jgi:hypothetical protein